MRAACRSRLPSLRSRRACRAARQHRDRRSRSLAVDWPSRPPVAGCRNLRRAAAWPSLRRRAAVSLSRRQPVAWPSRPLRSPSRRAPAPRARAPARPWQDESRTAPQSYWIGLGAGALALVAVLRAAQLRPARGLQDAAGIVLPAAGADHGGARVDRVRPGHAHRGRRRGRARRLPARRCLPPAQLRDGEGSGVPDGQDHGDGVLAVRGLGPVLRRVRHPRRTGADRGAGCSREPHRPSS